MQYQPPFGFDDLNAHYINGDPSIGRAGSIPPAQSIEYPMREIVAAIHYAGMSPSDFDLTQAVKAVRGGKLNYMVDTGPVNQMSVTPLLPLDAYTEGLPVRVKVGITNTGPTTLNISGRGNVSIKKANGANVASGDLVAGMVLELVYDGVNFQIVNFLGVSATNTINNYYSLALPYVADSSSVSNSIIGLFTPPITSLFAGLIIAVKVANPISGATTIVVNSNPSKAVVHGDGTPLSPGQAVAGQILLMIYDGTAFQISGSGKAQSDVVKDARFAYATFSNGAFMTGAVGINTALGPWQAGFGDPTVVAGFNLANGIFTVPTGFDGFWMFQAFATAQGGTSYALKGSALRIYKGLIPTGPDPSAGSIGGNSCPGFTGIGGVGNIYNQDIGMAFAALTAGQTVQLGWLCDDPGIALNRFSFTAILLGKSP